MQAVCTGSNATDVTSYICKNCGGSTQAALDDFEAACLGAGLDICKATGTPYHGPVDYLLIPHSGRRCMLGEDWIQLWFAHGDIKRDNDDWWR